MTCFRAVASMANYGDNTDHMPATVYRHHDVMFMWFANLMLRVNTYSRIWCWKEPLHHC